MKKNVIRAVNCAFIFFSSLLFANSPQLQIFTELSPPNQIMLDNKVSGVTTDKVRQLLQQAKLVGEFHMYPWARALKNAKNTPNSLIYSIAKNDERNKHFVWLMPVTSYEFGLVSLTKSSKIQIQSIDELKHYVIAVQRLDISHNWALKHGLVEGKHFIVSPDIEYSWKLLLNEKVDYIIESQKLMKSMLKQFKLKENTAKYVLPIKDLKLVGYLAANKNIAPEVLKKLTDVITPSQVDFQSK